MAFEQLGAAGAGASQGLATVLAQQLLQQQLAQRAKEAAQQAEIQRAHLAQRAKEAQDITGYRNETLDLQKRGIREEDNQKGVRQMIGSFLMQRQGALTPEDRRAVAALQIEGGGIPSADLLSEPEDPEIGRQRDLADYEDRKKIDARYRAPTSSSRPEMTPGQAFSATRALRNDFTRETAAARAVQTQYTLMQSSLAAARKGDMAAGSQGVLVTFQKILDPTSVVRESEYARSASGQSLLSRIEGAAVKLERGGAGVPLSELEAFVRLAEQFAKNQAKAAQETKTQIEEISADYGIDPSRVTRDIGPPETPETAPPETAVPGAETAYERYLRRQQEGAR